MPPERLAADAPMLGRRESRKKNLRARVGARDADCAEKSGVRHRTAVLEPQRRGLSSASRPSGGSTRGELEFVPKPIDDVRF